MLKNITLSAEDLLIKKAREKARKEHITLNALFRQWLKRYIGNTEPEQDYNLFMQEMEYVDAGRKFSREELHER
jgi:hypothetical protein